MYTSSFSSSSSSNEENQISLHIHEKEKSSHCVIDVGDDESLSQYSLSSGLGDEPLSQYSSSSDEPLSQDYLVH